MLMYALTMTYKTLLPIDVYNNKKDCLIRIHYRYKNGNNFKFKAFL